MSSRGAVGLALLLGAGGLLALAAASKEDDDDDDDGGDPLPNLGTKPNPVPPIPPRAPSSSPPLAPPPPGAPPPTAPTTGASGMIAGKSYAFVVRARDPVTVANEAALRAALALDMVRAGFGPGLGLISSLSLLGVAGSDPYAWAGTATWVSTSSLFATAGSAELVTIEHMQPLGGLVA